MSEAYTRTKLDDVSKDVPESFWHDDGGESSLGVVDEEERDRGDDGDRQLVAPADVKHVVQEAEQGGREERQQCR